MNSGNHCRKATRRLLELAVGALALLAIVACGSSEEEPASSPTPPPGMFSTLPTREPAEVDDQPTTIEVKTKESTPVPTPTQTPTPVPTPDPTATPIPIVSPTPTATPVPGPTAAPGPTVPPVTGERTIPTPDAGPTPTPGQVPTLQINIPKKTELEHPKAETKLNELVARVQSGEISAGEAAQEAPLHQGESVGVTIYLSGNEDAVISFLEANGASNVTLREDYIEAFVPVILLGETSEQSGVLSVELIQLPESPQSNSGTTGNGPVVHGSKAWNDAGYTGQNVKIGIIDNGFYGFLDLMGADLPSSVEARCYHSWLYPSSQDLTLCPTHDLNGNPIFHGTIVAESVMDIAPDASLYIANPRTKGQLQDVVDWMISEEVSVINQSQVWDFDGPGDGTSPFSTSPLKAIDRAVSAGIVWVNAAGNHAERTWFMPGPFSFSTVNIDGENRRFVNFSESEYENTFSIRRLELRWEGSWRGASKDMDLILVNPDDSNDTRHSRNFQSGDTWHKPYEWVKANGTYNVMIEHSGGNEPEWIQLVSLKGSDLEFATPEMGSILNPAESANPGMLTVGATAWDETNTINSYSSRGPTPDGRVKPDGVGADCGQTAISSKFCGTSQASPHVAGMAALVRQRFPNYTPAQVVTYLKDNAQQRIDSPNPNNTWGHGFLVLPPVAGTTVAAEPAAPTALTATANGNTQINLLWTAPSDNGGAAISGYLIEVSTNGSTWSDLVVNTRSTSTNYTHSGLTADITRHYRVSAINSAGNGPASNSANATTDSPTTPQEGTSSCATGGAVADPANNSLLVSDCDTLLEVRDTLAGTVTLNWAAGTLITNWDGVTVGGTPQRIIVLYFPFQGLTGILPPELGNLTGLTQLSLLGNKLTGPIPSELANLSQLTHIFLGDNQLSGPIPSELGRMTNLQGLELYGNRLTGTIPTELGRLTSMQGLHIDNNQLTGTIPAELGRLSNLRWLTLHDNRLTGEIPAELGRLTNLQQLYLSGNRFSGCVPTGLRGVSETDRTHLLKDIGIPYCDVLLSGLRVTSGTLSPQFDAYVTDYRAAARASRITVSPSSRHNATFEYLDRDDNVLADADGAQTGYQVDAPATMATTIKIKVTSSDGKANHTYTIQLTGPGALGAPEVHQVTAGTNSLTVSWTAPSSDGGSSITAYDLRHIRSDATNKGDANWTVVQDVWTSSGARSYELADLDGGTQYDVQVRPVNSAGDGPWSVTASGTPTTEQSAPGSPANAQYEHVGTTTVVTWDQSAGATHYKLYHSDSRFPRCSLFSSGRTSGCDELAANVAATTYEHTSPDANTNSYWITACNAAGCSEIDSGNPARFVDSRPAAPANAQYVRVGTTTVVTWDPSAGATHYKVYYDDFFGTSCRLSSESPSFCELLAGNVTGTTYTHASPDDDINYYWITACNSAGCSDIDSGNPATLVESTRSATEPGAPTGLTATANGQTQIDLSWTAPSDDGGSNIIGYKIEVSTNGLTWSDLVANTNSTSTSYSHTSLTAGTTRHYRVSAVNSADTGPASNTANATTTAAGVPSVPVIAGVVGGADALTVSWSAPPSDGGSSITAYDLRHIRSDATNKGDANWTVVQDVWTGSGARSYELADLDGGTQYDVQVRAVNSTGDGSWSVTATGIPTTEQSAPGSPANAQYVRVGTTTVVSWDPSAGATHYKLFHSDSRFPRCSLFPSGRISGCDELAANVAATTYEHTSPDANTNSYWITACNAAGCSEIDSANPAQFLDNRPVAPANGRYRNVGSTIVVSWDPSAGAAHYKVYYDDFFDSSCRIGSGGSPSFCEELAGNVTGTTYTHASPDDDTNYYWVTACNDAGCSNIDSANPARLDDAAPAPDLVVDTPTVSDSAPAAGDRFTLNATVRNQGNGESSFTTLRYYRSTDSTITTGDTAVGTDSVSRLSASGTSAESISVTAPSTEGTYYYGACVDSVTDESNTNNNCSVAVTVTVGAAPAPDLVVDTPTVSDSAPAAGDRFTLNATVRNQGNGESSFTTLRYYQSTDSTITTGDTAVGTDSVSRLSASGTSAAFVSVTAPSTAGTYYYGACVDSVTDESNTNNNCSVAVTVTVGAASAPDLVVDTPNVSTIRPDNNPIAGKSFGLSAVVQNEGSAGSPTTTLRFYLSTDSTISSTDTEIDTVSVVALGAPGGFVGNTGPTAPSTAGIYYYGACVDSVTDETDDTNNCSMALKVTVIPASAPDLEVGTPRVSESSPAAGSQFTLRASVSNDGTGPASPTTLRYFRSTDSTISSSDTELGTDDIAELVVWDFVNQSIDLVAPSTLGTHYYGYCVDSVTDEYDLSNNCSTGISVNVQRASPEVTKPSAPTGLTATANGQTQIDLSWTEPSDDGGATITGYKIEVSTDGSNWSDLVADTKSTSTSYSHTGLAAGSTRHYRVSAINSEGAGTASNVDNAITESITGPVSDSICVANLSVQPGSSCTYPNTSAEFSVSASGTGQFLIFSSGSKLEIRNANINGITYTFVASKQADGSWLVEEVG